MNDMSANSNEHQFLDGIPAPGYYSDETGGFISGLEGGYPYYNPDGSVSQYCTCMSPGQGGEVYRKYGEEDDMFRGMSADKIPDTLLNPVYMPGALRRYIGETVKAEFLVGEHTEEKTGRLVQVGAGYMALQLPDGDNIVICDLYSVKFITVSSGLPEGIYGEDDINVNKGYRD